MNTDKCLEEPNKIQNGVPWHALLQPFTIIRVIFNAMQICILSNFFMIILLFT